MNEKRCTNCHQVKPLSCFSVRRASPDGLQPLCKPCARKRWLAYYDHAAPHYLQRRREKAAQAKREERKAR